LDRSSRPRRSPGRTPAELERRVWAARERNGCSRAPRLPRTAFVRYEWPCPGDLLHMDVKRYPRFTREGHAVTGDRSKTYAEKRDALPISRAHNLPGQDS